MKHLRRSSRETENLDLARLGQALVDAKVDQTTVAERLEVLAMLMDLDPLPARPSDNPDLLLALHDGRKVLCIIPKFGPNRWTVVVED